jgi:alpha-tubulin suppressor-like RCC1 family protein
MSRVRSLLWSAAILSVSAGCESEGPNLTGIDPMNIESVDVTPAVDTVFVADTAFITDTVQFRAVVTLKRGGLRDDLELVWESSNPDVAVVDQDGTVFPTGLGTAKITASAGVEGEATIVVAQIAVEGLTLLPGADTVIVGETTQFAAQVLGPGGHPASGFSYQFSSSDAAIAAVSGTGVVTGVAPGVATISVSAAGLTTTAQITVLPRVFLQVSAGRDFSCGRISTDRTYCWGIDSVGQLGAVQGDTVCIDDLALNPQDRTDFPCSLNPQRVQGDRQFVQVAAGGAQACALDGTGAAWCWGKSDAGQVGNGSVDDQPAPVLVTSALRFSSIVAGERHTCAIDINGRAWCWGDDTGGQLGNFKRARSTTPIPVEGGVSFAALTAGARHTCGLTNAGAVYCWGSNEGGQIGPNAPGVGSDTPVQVSGVTLSSVSAGATATCGLSTGGQLYCWGIGTEGQLGTGGAENSATPRLVAGGRMYQSVSVGGTHACAVTTAGDAECWGTFALGPLGPELFATTPTQVAGGLKFVSVTSGLRHTCGIATTGETYCWGSNVLGPFGDGLQALYRPRPVLPVGTPQ